MVQEARHTEGKEKEVTNYTPHPTAQRRAEFGDPHWNSWAVNQALYLRRGLVVLNNLDDHLPSPAPLCGVGRVGG